MNHDTKVQIIQNNSNYTISHYMPKFLVKKYIHTIRSKCLCWSHSEQHNLNLFSNKVTGQNLLHVCSHLMRHRVETIINLRTCTCIEQAIKVIRCHLNLYLPPSPPMYHLNFLLPICDFSFYVVML